MSLSTTMLQPTEPIKTLRTCPKCSSEVKDIAINNEEELEMCTNTKCIYPFSRNDVMTIKCTDNQTVSEVSQHLDDNRPDVIDIQQFMDQLTRDNNQELTEDISDIISELVNSNPMFHDVLIAANGFQTR